MKKVELAKIITGESGAIDIMLYSDGECVAFLENYDYIDDAINFAKNNAENYEIIDVETEEILVVNASGQLIHYNAAVNMMDDDLRNELAVELAPCTDQKFFEAYEKAHQEKFDEVWELSKNNPVY